MQVVTSCFIKLTGYIADRGDDGGDWGYNRSNFSRGGRGGGRRGGYQDRGLDEFQPADPG